MSDVQSCWDLIVRRRSMRGDLEICSHGAKGARSLADRARVVKSVTTTSGNLLKTALQDLSRDSSPEGEFLR